MREHDFRAPRWGHNIYVNEKKDEPGTYKGLVIVTPGISKGDTLVWRTTYGHAKATVTHSKWKGDPVDMYEVEATVTERIADPSIVSQEEIDRFFGQVS